MHGGRNMNVLFGTSVASMLAAASLSMAPMTVGPAAAQAAKTEAAPPAGASRMVDRGRYLAKIAGCNDCHTPGYALKGGKVAEKDWLTGDALGWRGDWGTTYPANLRTYMQNMSETQWVKTAKSIQTRPPMPWFALHDLSEQDLRAFYRFVRHLGPAGQRAPAYVPPGQVPQGPYIQFPGAPQ